MSNPPNLERVFELLDNKLISWGAPGVLLAVGINQFAAGAWGRASACVVGAGGLWLIIKVGKRLAPKFDEALDWSIAEGEAWVKRTWNLSAFERHYIQQQAFHFEEDRIEGLERDRDRIPLLEEVFVPLELSNDAYALFHQDQKLAGQELAKQQLAKQQLAEQWHREDSLHIWDLLAKSKSDRRFRTMSILAKGGMGKTTLMKRIAVRYGQGKQPRNAPNLIPVLLRLRSLIDILIQDPPPLLPTLIREHHLATLGEPALTPPAQWAENILRQGRSLIMFDGFDEVPEQHRPQVSQWIEKQIRNYPEAIFIVTSRPAGFTKQFYTAPRPALTVFIKPFSPNQQAQFIRRWYWCQEVALRSRKQRKHARNQAQKRAEGLIAEIQERREDLGYMAENPLLLNMLVSFHRNTQGQPLPQQRLDLYQRIVQLQLDDRPRSRGIRLLLPYPTSIGLLQRIALTMVRAKRTTIAKNSLLQLLQKLPLWEEESVEAPAWVEQILAVNELLVEREPGQYEFPHASFQGFFAASYLVNVENKDQFNANLKQVLKNWNEAIWRETVLLYTAQLSPKLLNQVLRQACQINSEAAQLAADCLREYPRPGKIDPQLQQELEQLTQVVTDAKYQQLEAFLAAQEWKKADEETYRLMITTVGKEEGQLFEREELLNFPCEDLLTIDRLWRKYSNDRYGFSVQKEIYVRCGAKLDGEYPGDEIWKKFGAAVGWYVNQEWYRDILYDGTGVQGHLPKMGEIFYTKPILLSYSSLASRLVNCSG
ncbi:MAG: hypothetical protein RLZZ435_1727 [Cyanobacteriota bacterium]